MDTFVVWDLDNPDTEPTVYEFGRDENRRLGVSGDALMRIDGDYILFQDSQSDGSDKACALNYTDGMFACGTAETSGELAFNGGRFLHVLGRDAGDSNGSNSRSAIGSIVTEIGILTFLEAGDAAGSNFIDGSTTNNGVFGWGQMGAITDDGSLTFISGFDGVGSGEYLQVSSGGTFSHVPCLTCVEDNYGTRGSNVNIWGNTLAFKNGDSSSTHVAFIILP